MFCLIKNSYISKDVLQNLARKNPGQNNWKK